MWILSTDNDEHVGALRFRLTLDSIKTLGRAPRADFVVDGPLVSRLHCRLTVAASGQLEVEDLGSTNGTYVNGRRVSRAVLVAGDRLKVGRVELAVTQKNRTSEQVTRVDLRDGSHAPRARRGRFAGH